MRFSNTLLPSYQCFRVWRRGIDECKHAGQPATYTDGTRTGFGYIHRCPIACCETNPRNQSAARSNVKSLVKEWLQLLITQRKRIKM